MKLNKLQILFIGALLLSTFGFPINQEADTRLRSQTFVEHIHQNVYSKDAQTFKYVSDKLQIKPNKEVTNFSQTIAFEHSKQSSEIYLKVNILHASFKDKISHQYLFASIPITSDVYLI